MSRQRRMSLIPRRVGSAGWVMGLIVSQRFSLRARKGEAEARPFRQITNDVLTGEKCGLTATLFT
jgi:hypothetical protein